MFLWWSSPLHLSILLALRPSYGSLAFPIWRRLLSFRLHAPPPLPTSFPDPAGSIRLFPQSRTLILVVSAVPICSLLCQHPPRRVHPPHVFASPQPRPLMLSARKILPTPGWDGDEADQAVPCANYPKSPLAVFEYSSRIVRFLQFHNQMQTVHLRIMPSWTFQR